MPLWEQCCFTNVAAHSQHDDADVTMSPVQHVVPESMKREIRQARVNTVIKWSDARYKLHVAVTALCLHCVAPARSSEAVTTAVKYIIGILAGANYLCSMPLKTHSI